MRKGKYFEYSKIIVNHLYQNDFSVDFAIDNRCSHLAENLDIPKTSFFDVLRLLEKQKIIEINKKRKRLYDGLWISYFNRIRLTRQGLIFYAENILDANSHL